MRKFFTQNLVVVSVLIATNSLYLVTSSTFSTSALHNSTALATSAKTENDKKKPALLQNRLQQATQLFEQGEREHSQKQYSKAEKTLFAALKVLNDGIRPKGFSFPQSRSRILSFGNWFKIELPHDSEIIQQIFGNTFIPAMSGFDISVNISLDDLYISLTKQINRNNNISNISNNEIINSSNSYNDTIARNIVDCARDKDKICRDVNSVNNALERIKPSADKNLIGKIEDNQQLDKKILQLLQRVLIAQNKKSKMELALRTAQYYHNLELFRMVPASIYALNEEVMSNQKTTDNELSRLIPPKTLHANDIKDLFHKENATLVYYSIVSPQEIFVWVVQPSKNIYFKSIDLTSLDKPLEELIKSALKSASSYVRGKDGKLSVQAVRDLNLRNNLRSNITSANIGDFTTGKDEQKKNLQQLYQKLIAPIEEFLPQDPDSHVVIVPQGELLLAPFSVLQDPSGKYLIEKHTTRITPNIYNLARKNSSLMKMPQSNEMLIVGNPNNPETKKLPGSEREAKEIGRLFDSYPLIGNDARQEVILNQIKNKKIIHFATHGILDRPKNKFYDDIILLINSSRNSTIVNRIVRRGNVKHENHKFWYNLWFNKNNTIELIRTNGSLPGAIVLANDSLTSQEILNLKLDADLAVLSACNTAKGITQDTIVLGLPLSLGVAGVPRVAVSLWAVPDAATELLMTKFYQEMKRQEEEEQKVDEAQALRKAMLDIKKINEYSDPIHWAGFTLIDTYYKRDSN